jgi:hypothetical protein
MGWPVALLLSVVVLSVSVLVCVGLVIRARFGSFTGQPMPITGADAASEANTECGLAPRVSALESRFERLEASVNSLRLGAKL